MKTLIPKTQLNSRTRERIMFWEAVIPHLWLFESCNRMISSVFAIIESYREFVSVETFIYYFGSLI